MRPLAGRAARADTLGGTAARQASLREHNLALVLGQIAAAPRPPSRAELAGRTGLTRATVSALVDDLIGGQLLTEVAPAPRTGAGRPALGLALATEGPAGLGLEINVDYLAAGLVDLTGAVRHHVVRRADLRPLPSAEVLRQLAELAGLARAEAQRQRLTPVGAALAVPGLLTPPGQVRLAPNLGWRNVDLISALTGEPGLAGLPLRVDNEANLAALGELHTGGQARDTFLYLSGEIGVGAGIVLEGSLYRGARGWSGEIGHIPVHPRGRGCRCGARGCLEQYAGQERILALAGLDDRGLPADDMIDQLVTAATAGQAPVRQALTGAGSALGIAVSGVLNLLDIPTVVLGGSYAPLAPWLTPPIEAEISRRVLTAGWSPVAVRPARLGNAAAVVGAAGSVIREVLARPAHWLSARS